MTAVSGAAAEERQLDGILLLIRKAVPYVDDVRTENIAVGEHDAGLNAVGLLPVGKIVEAHIPIAAGRAAVIIKGVLVVNVLPGGVVDIVEGDERRGGSGFQHGSLGQRNRLLRLFCAFLFLHVFRRRRCFFYRFVPLRLRRQNRGTGKAQKAEKRKDESQNFVSCFQRGVFLLAVVWGVLAYPSGGTPWKNQIGNICVPPSSFYVGPYLSSTPPDREVTRRQRAALLHENCTPPRVSPSRPHCVNCGWAEVSLSPCAVMAVPAAVRQFRADGIALRKGSWRVTRRASLSRHMGMYLVNGYELVNDS